MDLAQHIRKIAFEANSDYNDGWTKAHYQKQLDEIRAIVNETIEKSDK